MDASDLAALFQDNKAMNMFSMDHMLKDGWSGFYSQGYMYFDNCSSLFLPKVCDQRRPRPLPVHESTRDPPLFPVFSHSGVLFGLQPLSAPQQPEGTLIVD